MTRCTLDASPLSEAATDLNWQKSAISALSSHTTRWTELERTLPIPFPNGIGAIELRGDAASWAYGEWSSIEKLLAMAALSPNWDSRGAVAIDRNSILATLHWLIRLHVVQPALPTPAIVPLASGRLQLEWHRHGHDVEIEVVSSTVCDVFVFDIERNACEEFAVDADRDLNRLVDIVGRLV